MTDLIDTTEMYLRTIFELEEEGIVPLRARIAERLGHSGPTVSQTVARMERDGLLSVSGDRHLQLSDEGRRVATAVMRKHRLAERLLVDIIGLDWQLAHDEACRWEHVISEQVETRILGLLGDRTESPYGNPIPGLEGLTGGRDAGVDAPQAPFLTPGVRAVSQVAEGAEVVATLRRIGEPAQGDPDLLDLFAGLALRPGAELRVERQGERVHLRCAAGEALLSAELATHVFVEIPSAP